MTAPDLATQVCARAARDPDAPALWAGTTAVTIGTLVARARRLAAGLRRHGLVGQRVALAVHIGADASVMYLACQLAGIAPAMLPVPAHADEVLAFAAVVAPLAHAFAPEAVVFDPQSLARIEAASAIDHWRGDRAARVWTEAELATRDDAVTDPPPPAPEAPAHYLFTSGTTGRSKIVQLSQRAVVGNTRYVAERWGFGAGDRLPVVGAPYHSGGLMVGLIMPLYVGASAVTIAEPPTRPAAWLRALAATGCTHLVGGDGLLRGLVLGAADDAGAPSYPALRALVIGGEPLDLRTLALVTRHFAPRGHALHIFTAYGMTEAAGLIATSTHPRPSQLRLRRAALDRGRIEPVVGDGGDGDDLVAISCGTPSHDVAIRIVDAAGREVADGELGRVEFHSPYLFDGYVTGDALDAPGRGFFPTGDLGFRYHGELYLRGRLKEALRAGGTLIAAERAETIARAAAVAVAGHHNLAAMAVTAAGELAGDAEADEVWLMQEVSGGAAAWPAAARAVAAALFEGLPLASCRVLLFAPGALPRLCTSAKRVRILAAAAIARGALAPCFAQRFTAAQLGAERGDRASDRAWRAADLARDTRWSIQLAPAQTAAVRRAAQARWSSDELTASLREVLERARGEAAHGVGFARIRGLPHDLALDDLAHMIAAIGDAIGERMPQNPAGERLAQVRDHGEGAAARGYLSNHALAPHTDTADMLALFCVRGAATGGETALVSALQIFRELAALDAAEVLDTLRTGLTYAYPDEAAGGPPHPPIPVFSDHGGQISCRYLRAFVELAAQRAGTPLAERDRRALDMFDELATRPALQHRVALAPGELLLVNNYSVLHARTSFEDDPAQQRLLLRLWLNRPGFRSVIPALQHLAQRFAGR